MLQTEHSNCTYSKFGRKSCLDDKDIDIIRHSMENANLTNVNNNLIFKLNSIIERNADDKTELSALIDDDIFKIIMPDLVVAMLKENFKPLGPTDNELYNNFVINNAMAALHGTYNNFRNYDCELVDFMKHQGERTTNLSSDLNDLPNKLDMYFGDKRGYDCFGCVLNTLTRDKIHTVGHWVALFGDFRNEKCTIEYYNSSGNPAKKDVEEWCKQLAEKIVYEHERPCLFLNVSNVESQTGGTECGIYALNYIVSRVIGIPYKEFRKKKIPDDVVNKARKFLFIEEKLLDKSQAKKDAILQTAVGGNKELKKKLREQMLI